MKRFLFGFEKLNDDLAPKTMLVTLQSRKMTRGYTRDKDKVSLVLRGARASVLERTGRSLPRSPALCL